MLEFDMEFFHKNFSKIFNVSFIFENFDKKEKSSHEFWKINEFIW